MDAFNRFSIEDFLAYFFPGVIGSVGIFLCLLLTPLKPQLINLSLSVTTGVVLVVWSYVFGIILAGLCSYLLRFVLRVYRFEDPRESIPFSQDVQVSIINAYRAAFKPDQTVKANWSSDQYHLCRFLVESYVPNASQFIRRQISLRRLRENLIPTVIIWFLVGVVWGIRCLIIGLAAWGIALLALDLILSPLLLHVLVQSWNGNRRREVRETYIALLAGVNTGAFRKPDKEAEGTRDKTN